MRALCPSRGTTPEAGGVVRAYTLRSRSARRPCPPYHRRVPAQDARQYRPTAEQLGALGERHGIGPIASVRPLAGGIVNPVLLLDERVVLRINVRDAVEPKVPKEAWVLRFLAEHP